MNTDILNELNNMGVNMTAEFVPFSQSRNAKKNPEIEDLSINWKITISRGNRSLTTDYFQGIGHLPKEIQQKSFNRVTKYEYEVVKFACETGKMGYYSDVSGRVLTKPSAKKINNPELTDVLGCLILDAEVLDYPTFESWADEFGYNNDSIKDRKTYDECVKSALQFMQLFTDAEIMKLRELYQDW